ncbi:TetR/AcrR family transcriptional regulator [Sinorhizobium meliloti]|uniref:TetR/AcrR family transcriptional regulator n=1 Tax=Rhizobium meliloti TaxID=382 RepID=UPI0012951493|nr:TetR/AcrR family transcriptional regulator [Sinorhizobium meliloti]MQW60085.1 TetR family transcriptional regulator [Sinorhizobium meliloti]
MEISAYKIDRRVARTRKALHQALIRLILEKSYDSITVDEICQKANVGRSTFYLHFTSKDDLKQSGLDHLRRELAEAATRATHSDQENRRLGFSLAMFEHARDHLDLYRALAGSRGGTVALGTIRQILSDLLRDELAANAVKTSGDHVPREFVVQYLVGAYMAVLTWWLDGGTKLPPELVDACSAA